MTLIHHLKQLEFMHQPTSNGRPWPNAGYILPFGSLRSPVYRVSRAMRAAGIGAILSFTAILAVGCSGDSNDGSGAGSGGTGTGAGTAGTGGTTSGSGGGSGGGGDLDSSTDCSLRTDIDTYAANMMKKGKNNIMSFLLVQSDPGPPIKGNNAWKIKVTGADGMPVSQGITIRVWMPEHGHDSPSKPTITYDNATGTYGLKPINMSVMGGVWRVSVTMNDNSDPPIPVDLADFNFCIN